MVNEARLPDRLDHAAQGMVHHPVAKRRGADQAAFRFEDVKIMVAAGLVGLALQFGLQPQQIAFEMKFKISHRSAIAFAAARSTIGAVEGLKRTNLWVEVLYVFIFQKIDSWGKSPHPRKSTESEIQQPEAQFYGVAAQRNPRSSRRSAES